MIGFQQRVAAEAVLTGQRLTAALAAVLVVVSSAIDCAIGLALLWRPWARRAALASVVVEGSPPARSQPDHAAPLGGPAWNAGQGPAGARARARRGRVAGRAVSHEFLLFLHVVGACVLLGTGVGIAFFMAMANRTRDVALIAHTAGVVVVADMVFTATAVVLQPVTGVLLARAAGWSLLEGWLLGALVSYVFTGAFWLPVVFIQVRLRRMATRSAGPRNAAPGRLPSSLPHLVRLRRAGLRRGARDRLADGGQAAPRLGRVPINPRRRGVRRRRSGPACVRIGPTAEAGRYPLPHA